MGSISCHNNTKFLHAIAEVCLNLMHKKWNSYVYLEPDTTIGNFEVRITTFTVTTRPLQFTHCADIRFLWHCLWNSIVTFTPSNSLGWVTHFETLPYTKPNVAPSEYIVVHLFTVFQSGACCFLSAYKGCENWDFPSSLACVTGILSAGLLVWRWAEFPYCTSEQSFGDFVVENFQWHFIVTWFGCPLAAFASLLFS
jgi:hypothetical protein